ncbi:GDP-mannose mannosyl hydrolase [Halogeometricum pallidum JCM 14848]|uniref:GDP-mannose mannosyl hydrolase n=1 Tax=Halogeometricum pallidum JCM 14848 TaxID=1227487 RepID=M0D785_HALPD|nr:NUDIX domain-containing protein [Halogeometricum pallidum]ELZ31366.1 GDP-mannose mannosyl hydrolase [Halogeometricum pallidum JCM 14848]
MKDDVSWVPEDEWASVVANVPIVSVDLIVRQEGGVLLGLRENEPAKGEWFVPGGTVLKNERLTEAIHRVAEMELGCEVKICERLGTFEHFYDTSEVEGVETKHYLANAFVVEPLQPVDAVDDQHSELRVFEPPFEGLHPYVQRYIDRIIWE